MPVIRTEIDTRIKKIKGVNCPKGEGLMIITRKDHLARRQMATNKIEVLMSLKSKNCLQ